MDFFISITLSENVVKRSLLAKQNDLRNMLVLLRISLKSFIIFSLGEKQFEKRIVHCFIGLELSLMVEFVYDVKINIVRKLIINS